MIEARIYEREIYEGDYCYSMQSIENTCTTCDKIAFSHFRVIFLYIA